MEGKKEAISKPKTTRDDIRFPTTKERKNHQRFVCVLQISCSFSFVLGLRLGLEQAGNPLASAPQPIDSKS